MNKSENKNKVLNEIKNSSFEYNAERNAAMIAEFERDGLVIVSRTKDGVDCDITDKGISFLCSGGYAAIEKEKSREQLKKNLERLFFTILGGALLYLMQLLIAALL